MTSISIPRRQQNVSTSTKTQLDSHVAWHSTLDASIACIRTLLSPAQASSKAWKAVNASQTGPASNHSTTSNTPAGLLNHADGASNSVPSTSQLRLDSSPAPHSVKVHRRTTSRGARDSSSSKTSIALLPPGSSQKSDIYRAVCQIPLSKREADADDAWDEVQDAFRRLLATPECRPLWDHMVEDSEVVEELDAATRVCRTIFRLGWPASHRDAITISKTITDGQTLLDVSTSLPRSPDAPAYLRPAPPYVRSHVNLFAWCLQRTDDSSLKVTAFWSWDLKGAWLGMPTGGLGAQLPVLVTSLISHAGDDASRVPSLANYGHNVEVTSRKFDPTRDMLTVEYQVICEQQTSSSDEEDGRVADSAEELQWSLPAAEGWDIHVDLRPLIASPTGRAFSAWQFKAVREGRGGEWKSSKVLARINHSKEEAKADIEQGLRGVVTIQRIAASQEVRLRLNDSPCVIEEVEAAAEDKTTSTLEDLLSSNNEKALAPALDDSASVSGLSIRSDFSSHSTATTVNDIKRTGTPSSVVDRELSTPTPTKTTTTTAGADTHNGKPVRHALGRSQALTGLIRRNYIYFTSLLQEPEAKWKHHSDTRGVTITQLDSIDPTLVVYRAEATFVGVSVWDIFATVGNAGVKSVWDKGAEEARLVEDLGDVSKLWHSKTKAAWPVSSRDSVTVETCYKSPSSIHLFSFSTEDRSLFPLLPKVELGTIRTQVDVRGWSIESLSPTTVHITLIEQSDPKGWTSKSSATPWAMTNAVAGVGDFSIKSGAPPIATRMLGAKTRLSRYEHDKGTFRLEYELLPRSSEEGEEDEDSGHVECEIRCDLESWASSLDLVVDPPPINVSCLRRHKLSQGGSGLWLTIEHVAASLEDDLARVTVRKASPGGKEKGIVHVNGARIKVDVNELGEEEVTLLKEKKRSKPRRVPLDLINQPAKAVGNKRNSALTEVAAAAATATAPLTGQSTPVSRAGTPAIDASTSQTVSETTDVFSDERPRQPMTCALDVLFLLRRIHAERGPDPAGNPAGWTLVSQRNGLFVRRRMMQSISTTIHVQRGDKVVEGLTAEDILSAISAIGCRKLWDEKVDSSMLLESFGNGASTGFFTTKASFPFRGRGFHLASLTARSGPSSMNLGSTATPTVFFHASASFPERNSSFSQPKLNPTSLPLGKVLIDGWILETLDPYSSTLNYQIPSTRCTHVVAVDYAGSLPIAVNTMWNSNLPRSILSVEDYVKSKGTLPSIRSPPCCVEVLGDGRDEDRNLIWNLEDDKSSRTCTLLTNTFDPSDKVFSVLVKIDSRMDREPHAASASVSAVVPAVPFPKRQQVAPTSSTSPTKGPATTAAASATAASTSANQSGANEGLLGPDAAALAAKAGDDQITSMSRATSVNSIRSITKSRPSAIRVNTKKPVDLVLMDVEVELRHYDKGYEVIAASELGQAEGQAEGSGSSNGSNYNSKSEQQQQQQLSLHAAPESAQALPIIVSSFDLPPSAVLAATLDPSARPRKHLLRLSLPTASFFAEARDDPLGGPEPDDAPKWFHNLRERGASIRLTIRPITNPQTATNSSKSNGNNSNTVSVASSEIDSQQVPVIYQGKGIEVTHVNQTSAMLQRESENEEGHARLKRVAPSIALKAEAEEKKSENILDDRLPGLLQHPIAAAKELKKSETEGKPKGTTTGAVKETISPSSSFTTTTASDFPDPATPMTKAGDAKAATSASTLLPSSASTPIMSILNAYPLSRLGASTAVTTAVANGGVFSNSAQARDRLQGEASRDGERGKGGEGEGKNDGKTANGVDGTLRSANATIKTTTAAAAAKARAESDMPGNLVLVTTETIRKRLSDIRFTLSTLILVAIIAFLFGSLVRSLLEPADFILVDPTSQTSPAHTGSGSIQEAARDEIMRLLESKRASPAPSSPTVAKRELKRLVELRNLFGGQWDLVIAAARR